MSKIAKKYEVSIIFIALVLLAAGIYVFFIPSKTTVKCVDSRGADGSLVCEIINAKYHRLIAGCEVTSGMGPGGAERSVWVKDKSFPASEINRLVEEHCTFISIK